MDIDAISNAIATLGFPIVLVAAMGWFIFTLWKQSASRETKLYEELAECRKVNKMAIETLAIYAERLKTIETDINTIKEDVTTIKNKGE